jgi:DNA-binding XRE family transcriptional regulator
MNKKKQADLEARGWHIGTVDELLGLTPDESTYVELKLALSRSVRQYRQSKHITQGNLAKRLQSSQSRVAKVEAGDESVSMDLMIRSLLAMGATREELAQIIAKDGIPV